MSPLASYRRLFTLAGPLYVAVAFVGRLPLAMAQMGALLLVAGTTGSYGTGGAAAGALAVANAVGAPVAGSLADRVGQRPPVPLRPAQRPEFNDHGSPPPVRSSDPGSPSAPRRTAPARPHTARRCRSR